MTHSCHAYSCWSLTFLLSSGRLREERSSRLRTCSKDRVTSSQSVAHAAGETHVCWQEHTTCKKLTFPGHCRGVVAVSEVSAEAAEKLQ